MVGNLSVSVAVDPQATLVKESSTSGVQLMLAHDSYTIIFQSGKGKHRQAVHLNDVYAVVQNGSELKLESCPRVVKHHWTLFRKVDKVRSFKLISF